MKNIPSSKAAVYVYRPDIFQNKGIKPGVKIDNIEYAAIPAGAYMPFLLDEGSHEMKLVLSDRFKGMESLKFEVFPNVEYFIRLETNYSMSSISAGSFTYRRSFRLLLVDAATGSTEILKNKLIDPEKGDRFSKSFFIED